MASLARRVSYGPFRTPLDGPTGNWLRRALRQTFIAGKINEPNPLLLGTRQFSAR